AISTTAETATAKARRARRGREGGAWLGSGEAQRSQRVKDRKEDLIVKEQVGLAGRFIVARAPRPCRSLSFQLAVRPHPWHGRPRTCESVFPPAWARRPCHGLMGSSFLLQSHQSAIMRPYRGFRRN